MNSTTEAVIAIRYRDSPALEVVIDGKRRMAKSSRTIQNELRMRSRFDSELT